MTSIACRSYRTDDFSACLSIFDSNVPVYFLPQERVEFCSHITGIDTITAPYLVISWNGAIAACGGLTFETSQRQASLSWGMVESSRHGAGLGTHLMQVRLALARSIPGIDQVALSTSQHTGGFYERFGFTVSAITPQGFGPELDRWDMILRLR